MPKAHKFVYTKSIDRKVITAAQAVLGLKIKSAKKMGHGEVNHVYKLVSEKQNYLARIFQYKSWPKDGVLEWIEAQLTKHGIPHAKILFYSRRPDFFPYGFMITEFIEGDNGELAVKKRRLTLAQAYAYIGAILKKVHKIRIKKFGFLNKGKGEFTDFLAWRMQDGRKRYDKLVKAGQLPQNLFHIIEHLLIKYLSRLKNKFQPVLNHGDPNRENAIWSKNHRWILIDWDNAFASTWLEDYADLTFWADFRHNKSFTSKRLKIFNRSFFRAHGSGGFTKNEIKAAERGLHILKCLRLMSYYYFDKKNKQDFAETKRKLYKLISKNS